MNVEKFKTLNADKILILELAEAMREADAALAYAEEIINAYVKPSQIPEPTLFKIGNAKRLIGKMLTKVET